MKSFSAVLACACLLISRRALATPPARLRLEGFDQMPSRLDRPHVNLDTHHPNKYFHEANFHPHYDGRFADRALNYFEQQESLRLLVQTFMGTMHSIGAETWLMHGTLLGWFWNRKILPWDNDLDVMVSESSIQFLASYHNMTMHRFRLPGSGNEQKSRNYLLEINPNYVHTHNDKDNHIDARWIDTESGLFIDITTLHYDDSSDDEGAMMVKDNHRYQFDQIFPLRRSTFEGTPVWIPYAYPDLLAEEYGPTCMSKTHWEGHHFDSEKQEWVPNQTMAPMVYGKEDNGNEAANFAGARGQKHRNYRKTG